MEQEVYCFVKISVLIRKATSKVICLCKAFLIALRAEYGYRILYFIHSRLRAAMVVFVVGQREDHPCLPVFVVALCK